LWRRRRTVDQWLIIHGRRPKNPRADVDDFGGVLDRGAQHPQWGLCPRSADNRGACALRSLVAMAVRRVESIVARRGAATGTRDAAWPQFGHGSAASNSAIGRNASNGPHRAQSYS